MKTFKDLIFKPHSIAIEGLMGYQGAKQSVVNFANDYGVSVLFGECFYSNGKDTYEVAILYKNTITYNTDITDDVLGYLSEDEVTEVMKRVQSLI
jgi:hypothetical protein